MTNHNFQHIFDQRNVAEEMIVLEMTACHLSLIFFSLNAFGKIYIVRTRDGENAEKKETRIIGDNFINFILDWKF